MGVKFVLLVMALLSAVPVANAVEAQQPETLSLTGEPLYAPPLPRSERTRLEAEISQARADVGREPANPEAALRLARAQRQLGRIGDALETLTRAVEGKADSPAVRLERGRGFVTIRKFELAQREFRKAVEKLPEARCDLAFALYLAADYRQSHEEYGKCANPGTFAYLAALRAGENAGPKPAPPEDPLPPAPEAKLPGAVQTKRDRPTASMGTTYMDAVERLLAGDKTAARDLLKPLVAKHKTAWMEPVYIAAEADYARIAEKRKRKKN